MNIAVLHPKDNSCRETFPEAVVKCWGVLVPDPRKDTLTRYPSQHFDDLKKFNPHYIIVEKDASLRDMVETQFGEGRKIFSNTQFLAQHIALENMFNAPSPEPPVIVEPVVEEPEPIAEPEPEPEVVEEPEPVVEEPEVAPEPEVVEEPEVVPEPEVVEEPVEEEMDPDEMFSG